MSVLDKIEDYEKSFIEEDGMIEAVPDWAFEGEDLLSEAEESLLLEAGAPSYVGWSGDKFIVGGWGGKNYAYKLDMAAIEAKMTDKYGNFGPVGRKLSGEEAKQEFLRRIKSSIQKGLWNVAFNRDILPKNPSGRVPFAGGLQSPQRFDLRWIDGSKVPSQVIGTRVTPGTVAHAGVSVPVIKTDKKPALSHATKSDLSPAMQQVLADAEALRNKIHALTFADFQGSPVAGDIHAVHDTLAKLTKRK